LSFLAKPDFYHHTTALERTFGKLCMVLFLLMMYGRYLLPVISVLPLRLGDRSLLRLQTVNTPDSQQGTSTHFRQQIAPIAAMPTYMGLSNADGSSNSNNTGVTTRRGSCNPAQRVEQYVCSLDKQWWPQRFQRFLLFHSRWLIEYH
jgi:hypothetical protein